MIRQVEVAPPGKPRYDDRTQYPSLLTHERSLPDSAAYEYTHVWDPHFPAIGAPHSHGTAKFQHQLQHQLQHQHQHQHQHQQIKDKETLKLVPLGTHSHQPKVGDNGGKVETTCSAHPGGGGGGGAVVTASGKPLVDPRPARVHVYETPRAGLHADETGGDCRGRPGPGPGDLALCYDDLDPEGKCDHVLGQGHGKAV